MATRNFIVRNGLTVPGPIVAGGSNGTVGQVLTSNGSSNVHWSTLDVAALTANNTSFV